MPSFLETSPIRTAAGTAVEVGAAASGVATADGGTCVAVGTRSGNVGTNVTCCSANPGVFVGEAVSEVEARSQPLSHSGTSASNPMSKCFMVLLEETALTATVHDLVKRAAPIFSTVLAILDSPTRFGPAQR